MQRILIIEDDPVTSKVYRNYLEREGFQVHEASDGPGGLNKIKEENPDAVLLDLMLPGLSGVEILKQLRALEQFRKLPVITYTNAFVPVMVEEVKKAGGTVVFDKASMTPNMLIMAFREALDGQ